MFSLLITLLGIIAIGIFSVQVYKTAVSTERNAPLWAVLTAAVGVAFQFIIPFIAAIALVMYYALTSNDPVRSISESEGLLWFMNIAFLIASVAGMMMISKHVSNVPDLPPTTNAPAPPPPPIFG